MLNCWCITWPVGFKRLSQLSVYLVTLAQRTRPAWRQFISCWAITYVFVWNSFKHKVECSLHVQIPVNDSRSWDPSRLRNVQIGSGAHRTPCCIGAEFLSGSEAAWGSTHLHLIPRLRMGGAIPLLSVYALMTWTENTFFSWPNKTMEFAKKYTNTVCLALINEEWRLLPLCGRLTHSSRGTCYVTGCEIHFFRRSSKKPGSWWRRQRLKKYGTSHFTTLRDIVLTSC